MNWVSQLFNLSRRSTDGMKAATGTESATKLNVSEIPVPSGSGARGKAVWMTTSNIGGSALTQDDRELASTNILSYRDDASDTYDLIRSLSIATPALSASVDAYVRTAITPTFTAVARATDGSFDTDATIALQNLILRMNVLKDYTEGFSNMDSLRSLSEAMAVELRRYGSCALELVLDESRMPYKLQPISVTTIEFKVDDQGLKPIQNIDNTEIDLDIPTFFYVSLDQDLTDAYATSPMESSIQSILFFQEFINDLRRIVKRAVHSRIRVELKAEDIWKRMPAAIKGNTEKEQTFIQQQIDAVADAINGLAPEDALVYLDNAEVEYLTAGNNSHSSELAELKTIIDSCVATGSKTSPTVLGQASKSSNIASTETMLFMKNAEGAVQLKLNELYSRVFTLALRLMGYDVVADFKYGTIDLRPDAELEAFKQMKQSRLLELLSLGLMEDPEVTIELFGRLPHANAPVLSGTGFYGSSSADVIANPYSNTSQTTLEKSTESDQPKNAKGENGGEDGN